MASKKVFSARFEASTRYDRTAYEALTEVSWKMFREHFAHTRTYPFIAALCVVVAASLVASFRKYSAPVIAVHVAVILFFLLAMPLSTVQGKKRLCKKAIKEVSAKGDFPFTVRFLFNEEVIRAKLPARQVADTPYDRITDLIRYGKWLFLFVGDRSYILQEGSMEDPQEFHRLEEFLSEKTGQTIWEMEVPAGRRRLAGI